MIYERNNKVYEWDDNKAQLNRIKHNVTFTEAVQVFEDDKRIVQYDYKHSTDTEERWTVIGRAGNILYVVYTERIENTRIISARRANKSERRLYNERLY